MLCRFPDRGRAGAMIAGSILMGRAHSQIEMAVWQLAVAQQSDKVWQRLSCPLPQIPPPQTRIILPRARSLLDVEELRVGRPGCSCAAAAHCHFSAGTGPGAASCGALHQLGDAGIVPGMHVDVFYPQDRPDAAVLPAEAVHGLQSDCVPGNPGSPSHVGHLPLAQSGDAKSSGPRTLGAELSFA